MLVPDNSTVHNNATVEFGGAHLISMVEEHADGGTTGCTQTRLTSPKEIHSSVFALPLQASLKHLYADRKIISTMVDPSRARVPGKASH